LKIIAKDLMVMQSWLGPVDVSNGIYPTADVIIIPPWLGSQYSVRENKVYRLKVK